ncbi:Polyprotein [Phytophthora palmivora]|uniref:Polyprotein n=1 Tax=Phytophthora palmivora TaxID=4796 RepID=A0A2P4YTH7_9STRA|nr:Polyprotein [Phytophthora palmivora]
MFTISQKGYCEKCLLLKSKAICPNPEILCFLAQRSRPGTANAVRTLAKYLNCFTHEHHVLAKRVLRYLRETTDYGLVWARSDKPDLQVAALVDAWCVPKKEVHLLTHADADLGNEKDDRRSVTKFVPHLEGCTFAYSSHKQSLNTDDTCSVPKIIVERTAAAIKSEHNICKELGVRRKGIVIYDDNQAGIAVIKANIGDYKAKGIDRKYHKFERGEFALEYCPSEDNLADILTKPLGPTQFKKLLNVMSVPAVGTGTQN